MGGKGEALLYSSSSGDRGLGWLALSSSLNVKPPCMSEVYEEDDMCCPFRRRRVGVGVVACCITAFIMVEEEGGGDMGRGAVLRIGLNVLIVVL